MSRLALYRIAAAAILAVVAIIGGAVVSNAHEDRLLASVAKRTAGQNAGSKRTVCRATGSAENPYVALVVGPNDVEHDGHADDINPSPATGCPDGSDGSPTPNPEPVTMLLFGAGLTGVAYIARRKAKGNS